MKKFDISTSKILLIILGVLVAIVIGFNSKAIGAKSNYGINGSSLYNQLESKSNTMLESAGSRITKSLHSILVD